MPSGDGSAIPRMRDAISASPRRNLQNVAAASRRRSRWANPPTRSQNRDGSAIPRMRDGCGVSPQATTGRSTALSND